MGGTLPFAARQRASAASSPRSPLVDPFEVYHKATAFIPPITNGTQNYSNAGIAKNYEYDSVVIGSSMTENFTPSQLDRLFGGQFVKLPINGGSPFNHKQMNGLRFPPTMCGACFTAWTSRH